MPRTNKKHFIIFNNGGVISATTPKDWARAHQAAFPNYTFEDSDSTPIVNIIESYLINNLGYRRVENDEIIIHYPFKEI
jgi:hypothetical protein